MENAKEYTSEELQWLTENRLSKFNNRITPSWIRELSENEIFVFGSNVNGFHGGGAARFAMNKFGAVWGNGEGLQGSSYAIPTMEGLANTDMAVKRFYLFARAHENYRFYVTPIGCGIAGYEPKDIAPMFFEIAHLDNVYLPLSFWKVLTNSRMFAKTCMTPSVMPSKNGVRKPALAKASAPMMKWWTSSMSMSTTRKTPTIIYIHSILIRTNRKGRGLRLLPFA